MEGPSLVVCVNFSGSTIPGKETTQRRGAASRSPRNIIVIVRTAGKTGATCHHSSAAMVKLHKDCVRRSLQKSRCTQDANQADENPEDVEHRIRQVLFEHGAPRKRNGVE